VTDVLHWFPVDSRIPYNLLFLVARTQQSPVPNSFATECA